MTLKKNQNIYLLLVVVSICLHIPVSHEWIWDDDLLIRGNESLHQTGFVWELWFHDLWYGSLGDHPRHFYRPLVVLDFWLDLQFVSSPYFLKLHSLFWHMGCIVGMWFFLKDRMTPKQRMFVLFLPAIHPFSLEITQFIAARNDAMAWCFSILCGISLQHLHKKGMVFLSVFFAICSMFCKENSILYLSFVGLYLFWEEPKKNHMNRFFLGSIGILIFYLCVRGLLGIPSPEIHVPSLDHISRYMVCFVDVESCPSALPPENGIDYRGIGILFVIVLWTIQQRTFVLNLATCFFMISVCLASISAALSQGMAHRYVYGSLFLGGIILYGSWKDKISWYVGGFMVVMLIGTTLQYRNHWTSTTHVFDHAWSIRKNKRIACALFKEFEKNKEYQQALFMLEFSLQNPPDPYCCLNASRFGMTIDSPEISIQFGTMGLQNGCMPTVEIYSPLSMSYLLTGDLQKAKELAERIIDDPYNFQPLIWKTLSLMGEATETQPKFVLSEIEKKQMEERAGYIFERLQKKKNINELQENQDRK